MSIKVNSNTIEITVHTSCYYALDLLCVKILVLISTQEYSQYLFIAVPHSATTISITFLLPQKVFSASSVTASDLILLNAGLFIKSLGSFVKSRLQL